MTTSRFDYTTLLAESMLEKPSYILAMNVLQSDMYRTNMDARDAVDAILAEHAAATDALRTPRPESDARDAKVAELVKVAERAMRTMDTVRNVEGNSLEFGSVRKLTGAMSEIRAAIAALTQPEATR